MFFLAIFTFFGGLEAQASKYEINLSNEQWSSMLLVDTCKDELQEAIDIAMKDMGDLEGDFVAVLPDVIGYQYFSVVFKRIDGNMVHSTDISVYEYEFDYLTDYDLHEDCLVVRPRGFIY